MNEIAMKNLRKSAVILSSRIDSIDWEATLDRISDWAAAHESRYVTICNVHSVVTAGQDSVFQTVINEADMATPDGAPVAWMLRRLGFSDQKRINGPDLMWKYCELAATRNESIFLYGGLPETLDLLKQRLIEAFPNLQVAGTYSPPFHAPSAVEDDVIVQKINASGAGTVWVSLGCPKQELWMAQHRGKINAVMIGVGAAFDYHAGAIARAPHWMQNSGLEWLYRLYSEPSRLWRRYLVTNTLFIVKAAKQLLSRNFG